MKILVSACLLGTPCRYDGKSQGCARLQELLEAHEVIAFCPEVRGGLPTPRVPAERQGDRVVNKAGIDVTEAYQKGAQACLETFITEACEIAILKDKSPSCGVERCYDGSFQRRLIPGSGVTAELLKEKGIPCYDEHSGEQYLQSLVP